MKNNWLEIAEKEMRSKVQQAYVEMYALMEQNEGIGYETAVKDCIRIMEDVFLLTPPEVKDDKTL